MQRRSFLRSLLAAIAATLWPHLAPHAAAAPAGNRFGHGIASGDPTVDAVILWTRVDGHTDGRVSVGWQVAEDEHMTKIVAEGTAQTGVERDFTVKVDATDLPAGRTLYYRFEAGGARSPVGRTRTLPEGHVTTARFAVVSCANYPAGYFHAYRDIAARNDLDAVVHLGDYLYEYAMGQYASEHAVELGRVPEPATECLTLADYRQRHAQYKRDPDSQAMHAAHPVIAVWDDHEIANDAWPGGAQNHQADEGPWPARRDAAVRAWFEWLPVRGKPGDPIFRDFRYGDLAQLIMLDTRLYGRDAQAYAGKNVTPASIRKALDDPQRRVLGAQQERWLQARLEEGRSAVWQILGQQIKVAEMLAPDLEPVVDLDGPTYLSREQLEGMIADSKQHAPSLLDTWDGYPAARRDLLADLARLARNPVILSGDMHAAMAAELPLEGGQAPIAAEFMAPSVTSPGIPASLPEKMPGALSDATLEQNPGIRFLDMDHRGWLCLCVTPERCTGDWYFVDDILRRDYLSRVAQTLWVEAGNAGALQSGPTVNSPLAASA